MITCPSFTLSLSQVEEAEVSEEDADEELEDEEADEEGEDEEEDEEEEIDEEEEEDEGEDEGDEPFVDEHGTKHYRGPYSYSGNYKNAKLAELFRMVAKDADCLRKKQMLKLMNKRLQLFDDKSAEMTEDESEDMFEEIDCNEDGTISQTAFQTYFFLQKNYGSGRGRGLVAFEDKDFDNVYWGLVKAASKVP